MTRSLLGFRIFAFIAFAGSSFAQARADGMSMQIEGKDWTATTIVASVLQMGNRKVISIGGKLEGSKISLMSFLLYPASADAPKGHYDLDPALRGKTLSSGFWGSGGFNADLLGGNPLEDPFRFKAGSLDITGYDPTSHTVTGTFSGTAVNNSGARKVTIQNGKLDAIELGP